MGDTFDLPELPDRAFTGLPLIVDSFAGGGGASTGIEMALGRGPDVAINHNPAALALHAANHPETLHLSENVYRVDPLDHLAGKHIGLMWFSPDCKHFSKAKGGKPVARNIRDLAWIIPGWIERIQKSGGRVDVVLMENVEEFAGWGPLIETERGLMPCPARKGETFAAWCKAIRKLGGKIERRELRACDYGAPTIRKRLFVCIRFDGQRIVWPEPTHGAPDSDDVKAGKLQKWRTAAECIDWSLPCPSIFDTKTEIMAKHGLRAVRPLANNTLARVAKGLRRYVLDAERPYLVSTNSPIGASGMVGGFPVAAAPYHAEETGVWMTGTRRGHRGTPLRSGVTAGETAPFLASIAHGDSGGRREYPLTEPHGVVTAGGISHALVAPVMATMRNSQKPWQSVTEPAHTVTAGGAGLTLIAPSIAKFMTGATGSDIAAPLPTVTANSYLKRPGGAAPLGILAPLLASLKGTTRRMGPVAQPHPTVCAEGNNSAVVAPVLTYAQQGGRCRSIEDPHHTICASKKDQNSMIAATMVHVGNGERKGQAPRALDITAPLNTVVAGGVKQYPVAAFLAQQNTGLVGHHATAPLSTIVGKGCTQSPVAAWLAKYYGTGDGAPATESMHTITTKDRIAPMQAELAAPPFDDTHAPRARQVAELLRQHGLWDDREFVTVKIGSTSFVIVDVGMRMLTPRELFNAQGFPADYVIEGVWHEHDGAWEFEAFPKDVQVSCVGNSVCPPLAEALVRSNCAHLVEAEEVAA
ncbi:DNA cytosine methyltransferase [Salipiger sp. PrR007]|uniref:DNA cytosine methyltransferase n=1 Tax=Salipiger sp. PrR007 TaxID=2706884 RepID=UPI0013B9B5F9|nr:DNA cytosine methyltransferase [Salipiger sp. PrR007]NDW33814.1 DNA methyltransferase [Salipiger sp. PrR007]